MTLLEINNESKFSTKMVFFILARSFGDSGIENIDYKYEGGANTDEGDVFIYVTQDGENGGRITITDDDE